MVTLVLGLLQIDYDGPDYSNHPGQIQIEHPRCPFYHTDRVTNDLVQMHHLLAGSIISNNVTFLLVPVSLELPDRAPHVLFFGVLFLFCL